MSVRHRARARLLSRLGGDAGGEDEHGSESPGEERCPACSLSAGSAARWIAYFVAEGNAEAEVVNAVRAALGPCGRHTRALVAARGGPEVFARAAVYLTREALLHVDAPRPVSPCPTCDRERWAEDHVLDQLAEVAGRSAPASTAGPGRRLCLPHLLRAVSRAEPGPAVQLADEGAAALRSFQGEELVVRVSGRDPDAMGRAALLRAAALPDRGPRLREWVLSLVALDGCPACLAERETVRELLEWLSTSSESEPWEIRLCAAHLGTLHALDALTARRVASALAVEWSGALARFAAALRGVPRGGLTGRSRGRREQAEALESLLGHEACRACDLGREAGERTCALIQAALGDPEVAAAFGRSHGLCLRHLSTLPAAVRQGPPAAILRARLSLVGWELEEAERKRSWFARWERSGSEVDAWRRLPGLLGGAEAGLPASRPGQTTPPGP